MVKRKQESDDHGNSTALSQTPRKRQKILSKPYYDNLSDELILRILSFLSLQELLKTELVCKRFRRLATDNGIWRQKFYDRFVQPRVKRLPIPLTPSIAYDNRYAKQYSLRTAKWLEHANKVHKESDWKRRYKVKLNWVRGHCEVHEVALDCPPKAQILVRFYKGVIFTAGKSCLQSYSQRKRPQLLNTHYWETEFRNPTALIVTSRGNITLVAVGFEHGEFEIYTVDDESCKFELESCCQTGHNESLSSLALTWPFVLTMSSHEVIELYEIQQSGDLPPYSSALLSLARLNSNMTLSPVSLSLRRVKTMLVASVVYSFNRLNAGWSLGIQEIKLDLSGRIIDSRLTSTVDTPLNDFPLRKSARMSSRSTSSAPFPLHPHLMHAPTSLSHSGCYILAGLSDNTLMVYTVTSTEERLEINGGRRLWGHTSSVASAEVSERGKALSISAKGDEVRVWELEDILSSYSLQKTSTELKPLRSPDPLHAAVLRRGNGIGLALPDMRDELTWTRHWVGFDDEQVVVLGTHDQSHVLSCYDFA